jgi:hypothetical protein
MAGRESHASNPLIADFILMSRKLEKLGFTYHRKNVLVIEPME